VSPRFAILTGTNIITVTARDASGNNSTDILTVTKSDGQSPTLSILSPEIGSVGSYVTTSAMLAMAGSASDDASVTQVTGVSDRGGSGAAAGTTSWSIPANRLEGWLRQRHCRDGDTTGPATRRPGTFTATLTDGRRADGDDCQSHRRAGLFHAAMRASALRLAPRPDAVGVTLV
jgi:hypothetical protein